METTEQPLEQKKRGRGRPRKNEGDSTAPYKPKTMGSNLLSSAHEYIQFLPDRSIDVCEEHLDAFFSTMFERQMIWKKRFVDKQEQPWTDDAIFQENKFPNLYRELDRSTQFLINSIIIKNKDTSLRNIIWKVLVYRLFNNPETFKLTSFVWEDGIPAYEAYENEKDKFSEFLGLIQKLGGNPFTNAYFVSSSFMQNASRTDAYTQVSLPELYGLINNIIDMCLLAETPEEIIRILKGIPGVSNFIAHELYNDMLYINKFTEHKPILFDVNDFVNLGPGAQLGIRLIFPSLESKREQTKRIHTLVQMAKTKLPEIEAKRGEKMPYVEYNKEADSYEITDKFNLTISNIEGWLCEYSKYWRLSIESGRKQRKFIETSSNDCYENLA